MKTPEERIKDLPKSHREFVRHRDDFGDISASTKLRETREKVKADRKKEDSKPNEVLDGH